MRSRRTGKGRWSGVGNLLTPTEWRRLYLQQGGECAVCGHALRDRYAVTHRPEQRVASVDHDHVVETALRAAGVDKQVAIRRTIRGLLCGYPCNRLLVRFWTRARLTAAAAYLEAWPAVAARVTDLPEARQ